MPTRRFVVRKQFLNPRLTSILALGVLLAACGPKRVPLPLAGSLTVTVNGLAAGASAAITVTGDADFSRAVTQTVTLADLPVGEYTVTAGLIADHMLKSPEVTTVLVEADKPAAVIVTYDAVTGPTVNGTSDEVHLPMHGSVDLQFTVTPGNNQSGGIEYELTGASGLIVHNGSGELGSSGGTVTVTVSDEDVLSPRLPGEYAVTMSVSSKEPGEGPDSTAVVAMNLLPRVTVGTDNAVSPVRGSLRGLLNDVRTEGRVITFDAALYSGAPLVIDLAAPLDLTGEVEISGPPGWSLPDSPQVILDGGGDAVGLVPVTLTGSANVILTNLWVRNGRGQFGGGINVGKDSTLTLENAYIRDNIATDTGGGIHNEGTLHVNEDSRIENNGAGVNGGGIYNSGSLLVSGGTRITGNNGLNGGGICTSSLGSSSVIDESFVVLNSARVGAGLYLGSGELTLSATEVGSNAASVRGGGIYADNRGYAIDQAWLTLADGSTVTGNTAVDGAGIYSYAVAELDGVRVEDNVSSAAGGGIRNHLIMDIRNSRIVGNIAGTRNGGIFTDGIMLLADSVVANNEAQGGSGGGIYHGWYGSDLMRGEQKTLTIERTEIADNLASDDGGGIYSLRRLIITDSWIHGNEAGRNGGGISAVGQPHPDTDPEHSGELRVFATTISGNVATDRGGGIYSGAQKCADTGCQDPVTNPNQVHLFLVNSTVTANTATWGGGLFLTSRNDAPAYLFFNTIAFNKVDGTADGQGGGVHASRLTTLLRGNIIARNTAGSNWPATRDLYEGIITDFGFPGLASDGHNYVSVRPDNVTMMPGSDIYPGNNLDLHPVADQLVGTLEDHGGFAPLLALAAGSTIHDHVPSAYCQVPAEDNPVQLTALLEDQRGEPRPVNGSCSIGAYQRQ